MHNPALTVVYLVSGFTQHRGRWHGIIHLRETLLAKGYSQGLDNRVEYLTWRDDFNRVANELSIVCSRHGYSPRVVVAGYSYGGWGAVHLCRELGVLGIDVSSLILCDPVNRPRWFPRPLPFLGSLVSRKYAPALTVSANVNEVHEFHQRVNRPQGHIVRPQWNETVMHSPIELDNPHDRMDDAPEFQECVLDAVSAM